MSISRSPRRQAAVPAADRNSGVIAPTDNPSGGSSSTCGLRTAGHRAAGHPGTDCQRHRPPDRRRRTGDPAGRAARPAGADGHQEGLRPGRLRRLHGAVGRQARAVLPDAGRAVRRPRGHHDRGPGRRRARCIRCRRRSSGTTPSSAGYCTPGQIMSAVCAAGRGPGRIRRGHPRVHERQPLPVRRLPEHRRGDPGGRRGGER